MIKDEKDIENGGEEENNELAMGEITPVGGEDEASFLPEEGGEEELLTDAEGVDVAGSELDGFESAAIEETEFVEDERLESIVESILFASDRPVSLASIKLVFKGTNIRTDKIKRCLDSLAVEYAGGRRGVTLEEVQGGWQLRTKVDNMEFLRRTLKTRSFKLSGPALEVLSIVAYKQPVVKHEIDEIRGVESGHLMRALMEKGLVNFLGKSELPGRPMQYGTTRRFLEIFGLRNLKELPTLSQIDELLPEGIGEEETKKPVLADVTDAMASDFKGGYSEGEEELQKIQAQLEEITTSTDFFEQEKLRQRELKDRDRAQDIRDALAMGDAVPNRDQNWLKKFDEALANGTTLAKLEAEQKAARFSQMKQGVPVEDAQSAETGPTGATVADTNPTAESEESLIESTEGLFEEDAPHMEDELPFIAEADDIDEEEGPASV